MSERKSWDVQPKRAARGSASPARQTPSAPRSVDVVRRPAARPQAVRRPAPRAPRPVRPAPGSGRLRDRRQKARKTGRIVLGVVLGILLAVLIYVLWLPQTRIQEIRAQGPGEAQMVEIARTTVAGTYAFILPRNSIFFFPKDEIRSAILSAHPEAGAISISRESFNGILIKATPRAQSFVWCGVDAETPFGDGTCFDTDAEGLVFKPAEVSTSTVVLTVASGTPMSAGDLRIYAPLDRALAEGDTPVGAHVVNAAVIPDALRFVKAIRAMGVPVSALSIRGDEGDLWMNRTTRITYVLGHEEEAAQLAASVVPGLPLSDGSIQYLDLRFKGKAYVKRYGE